MRRCCLRGFCFSLHHQANIGFICTLPPPPQIQTSKFKTCLIYFYFSALGNANFPLSRDKPCEGCNRIGMDMATCREFPMTWYSHYDMRGTPLERFILSKIGFKFIQSLGRESAKERTEKVPLSFPPLNYAQSF